MSGEDKLLAGRLLRTTRGAQTTSVQLSDAQSNINRLFHEVVPTVRWLATGRPQPWRPPTDVYETEGKVVVKVEVAGMSDEDFAISLSNRSLRISGTRHDPDRKQAYLQLEIPYGHFCTEVFLPYAVAYDEIEATYESGFLTVVLPRAEVRHVAIKDQDAQQAGEV
jgi:HSP20 family protein